MSRLLVVCALLFAACGGCNEDESENNAGGIEPYVSESCDSDADLDSDGLAGCADDDCRLSEHCIFDPPDPVAIRPDLASVGASSFLERYAFLFTGPDAVQRGVAEGAIDAVSIGALRGLVRSPSGEPLSQVAVTAVGEPDLGRTYTRADGHFDFALNADRSLSLRFEKPGFTPVYRTLRAAGHQHSTLDDVVLTPLDDSATTVDFSQTAFVVGSSSEDEQGARRTALVVPAGVEATLVMPNGETQPLERATIRMTEVTEGDDGPLAMPGRLPGASRYTFAAEFTVDEAEAAGAEHVEFSSPVFAYVDNFLGFRPGATVPSGWFDRSNPAWRGSMDGLVLRVDSVENGRAVFDVGEAEDIDLDAFGMTDEERRLIAQNYSVGDEVWRVPLKHFTPWDFNFPGGFPPGIIPPFGRSTCDSGACTGRTESGSIIDCDNQTLGEQIPLNGTPFTLAYNSARVPGRHATITIPLHDGTVPDDIREVRVSVDVAGARYEKTWDPDTETIPAVHEWVWDRHDVFGRFVQGATDATVVVSNIYDVSYNANCCLPTLAQGLRTTNQRLDEEEPGEFGQYVAPNGDVVGIGRDTVRVTRQETLKAGAWDVMRERLGGWTLDAHHRFDPNVPALHFGNGRSIAAQPGHRVLDRLAGRWPESPPQDPETPDGEQADEAWLGSRVDSPAVTADGSVYFATAFDVVRRVTPSGLLETVIGGPDAKLETELPDGKPGPEARFGAILRLQTAPNGLLHFYTESGIWRLEEDGRVSHLFGRDNTRFIGPDDENPWREEVPNLAAASLTIGVDGAFYFVDQDTIYKLTTDGRLRAIFKTPEEGTIHRIRVKRNDDIVMLFEPLTTDARWNHLMVLRADGQLVEVPDVPRGLMRIEIHPVTQEIFALVALPSASLAYARIDADGSMEMLVGGAIDNRLSAVTREVSDNDRASVPLHPLFNDFTFSPRGDLVFTNPSQVVRLRELLPTWTGGPYQIPSFDGQMVYGFLADGRHEATWDAWTGTKLWAFEYDQFGRLTAVIDRDGDQTTIERDANGEPTSIVGPYGVAWQLETDAAGLLVSLTSPAGEAWSMSYGDGGLLTGLTSPESEDWTFDYDDVGRLIRDDDATLSRAIEGTRQEVDFTTGEGRSTTYSKTLAGASSQAETTGNVRTESGQNDNDQGVAQLADGSTVVHERSVHPLGYIAGYTGFVGLYTPGGASFEASSIQTAAFASNELFGLESWDELTETSLGQLTTRWDGSTRTFTTETSGGRSASALLDELGRTVETRMPGVAARTIAYDASGRPSVVEQGDRRWTLAYDANGYLERIESPDGTAVLSRDVIGRVTQGTRPDSTVVGATWDGVSNVTSLTPPGRPAYEMTYNKRGQALTFSGPSSEYAFAYNDDYQLTSVTYPDSRVATIEYDANGRSAAVSTPERTMTLGFDDGVDGALDGSNNLLAAQTTTGVDLEFAYDGFLMTDMVWRGEVVGDVSWRFGEQLRLAGISVNGAEVPYAYDEDGALVQAGDQTIAYEAGTFRVASRTVGAVNVAMTYDQYGQLATMSTTAGLSFEYTYDDLGRVTAVTEVREGVSTTREYGYDLLGQLTEVTTDGVVTASYSYDANGNRLTAPNLSSASYSDEDELLSYDGRTFTYEAGQLSSMTDGATTTTFDYGMFGELLAVDDGTRLIEYEHDAFNRRVGKRVDGQLVQGFLYQDQLNPIAELDGAGTVVSRFVYGTRAHVPDFMIRGGATYAFVTDHLGSVRLVVDTASGVIMQELEYDEFGIVLTDTNPGFQPFGFAGGIYDTDTGLVRFGARDYDASLGRWTARDPIGFGGGQSNLFTYAASSPISFLDSDGLHRSALTSAATFALDFVFSSLVAGVTGAVGNGVVNAVSAPEGRRRKGWEIGFAAGWWSAVPGYGPYRTAVETNRGNASCEMNPIYPDDWALLDSALGAASGAAIGTVAFGPSGAVPGAIVGGGVQLLVGWISMPWAEIRNSFVVRP